MVMVRWRGPYFRWYSLPYGVTVCSLVILGCPLLILIFTSVYSFVVLISPLVVSVYLLVVPDCPLAVLA